MVFHVYTIKYVLIWFVLFQLLESVTMFKKEGLDLECHNENLQGKEDVWVFIEVFPGILDEIVTYIGLG